MGVLQNPPYSPDLASTDYHLFHSMSNHMRSTTFDDEDDLKTWLNNFFDTKPGEFWRSGINKLVEHWEEVSDGDYFFTIFKYFDFRKGTGIFACGNFSIEN
ncbi:hypothetical protein LAZ67_12002287 [Cordylochernes scorpioides]|uniref:Histone-lysine N-methyltransferase SETMAR n=1 Tax=Cordylochernes scorpioides TaxID=51811 RepID=A0ABY6L2I4_9ARAC|nr:hypothetical protein LAZ67_12002287 [Cordylochernes scorpioides]